ncbi:alpha/beta fold hydrolase [Streptomyces sp. NPDC048425]|uniref:alpha/beta fold hydrolase n=1 Tax=Streptomyces sp. NPDC048425 TaxID=3365548 RepID=UPI003715E282
MILERYEWGDASAPPLILIHGVGSRAESFQRVAEEEWGKHFRVIAFDLRGHNRSGWEPPWTHATYVADLVESVRALGIDRAHWAGYSFGGRLLLDLAAAHPELIERAVLLEPVIQIPPDLAMRRATEELTGDVWDSVEAFLKGHGATGDVPSEELAEAAVYFGTLPDGRVRRRTCQAAIVSVFSEFAGPSPAPETLTMPTMLLHAPAFELVTAEQRAAYEPYVDTVVEVPGMHDILVGAYERTASAVLEFLLV